MANNWVRMVLFLSAYSPLIVILALTSAYECREARYGLLALAGLSIVGLVIYWRKVNKISPLRYRFVKVTSRGDQVAAYVVTFIIPFLGFELNKWQHLVGFLILVISVAIVYVRVNLVYVNPLLYLVGYSFYETEDKNGLVRVLISKRGHLRPDQSIKCVQLGSYALLERKLDSGNDTK